MKDPSRILPDLPVGSEVLIVRLRSLGDMVLLTPALSALKGWRPDLRLSVLAEEPFAQVLEGNPAVSEIILRQSFVRTAAHLRGRRFAAVFNQHGGPTSGLLTAASGAPVKVCWEKSQFSFLYNVLAPRAETFYGRIDCHTVEERMIQFYWSGLPMGEIPPAKVYARPEKIDSMRRKLKAAGIKAAIPYMVIHPCANYDTKTWSLEGYGQVARWLRKDMGLVPVVVLGPADRRMADPVSKTVGRDAVIVDSFDLGELVALMSDARMFLGNDSGPAHVAAAAGLPVVVVFGSSSAERWGPWRVEGQALKADISCNPCPGDKCGVFDRPRCILHVTVDQVRDACLSVLGADMDGDIPG